MPSQGKMKYLFFIIPFLLCVLCAQGDKDIVAKVGDSGISYQDLGYFYRTHRFFDQPSVKDLTKDLEIMVQRRLKCLEMKELGYGQDSLVLWEIQPALNQVLINRFFDTQIVAKYVNEEKAIQFYQELEQDSAKPVPPFKEMRGNIEKLLREHYRPKFKQEYDSLITEYLPPESFSWNENALQEILAWGKNQAFFIIDYQDTLKRVIDAGRNKIVVTYNGGQFDYHDLFRYLYNMQDLKQIESPDKDE